MRQLRIIRLIDVNLCDGCRFKQIKKVTNENGRTEVMINCTRGDCDNWDTTGSTPAVEVEDLD